MKFSGASVLGNNKRVVIAGGGHAGLEAAFAVTRMGGSCTLVTMDPPAIGRLSCNPAIGGLGKSHLVKEVDALGGVMGFCSDLSGIQFKTLNKTKGRAVWANRVQVDKKTYPRHLKNILSKNTAIKIIKGEVVDFKTRNNCVSAVILKDKTQINCQAFIITCGTFLNGLIHIGPKTFSAGRMGERAATGLTQTLKQRGFTIGRLKTGTPPRLLASSIDWSLTKQSKGDCAPTPFSLYTKRPFVVDQELCFSINTNLDVHRVINNNLWKSPIFSGKIRGIGPRYCPSIEDKVFRFSNNPSHVLFLEPEWSGSEQIYLNGFSTSLPEDIQVKALRKIKALRDVRLIRPGYAIEYDYSPPYQLTNTLMSKSTRGLFFAGQINGTSGYEEAAAQGLVAGANAFLYLKRRPPLILSRQESYIGVMVDDLITSHLDEPYRMFTSRAEHRLFLRPDNCYSRLFGIAKQSGLLLAQQRRSCALLLETERAVFRWIQNNSLTVDGGSVKYEKYLKRPSVSILGILPKQFKSMCFYQEASFNVETNVKYEGYVLNELQRIKTTQGLEDLKIPRGFNYALLPGLSVESRSRLQRVLPQTIGQASRISGLRPTDVTLLGLILNKAVSRET